MKRILWAGSMSFLTVMLALTTPTRAAAAAADPCFQHPCHNGAECEAVGCLNGCGPLGKCNASDAPGR